MIVSFTTPVPEPDPARAKPARRSRFSRMLSNLNRHRQRILGKAVAKGGSAPAAGEGEGPSRVVHLAELATADCFSDEESDGHASDVDASSVDRFSCSASITSDALVVHDAGLPGPLPGPAGVDASVSAVAAASNTHHRCCAAGAPPDLPSRRVFRWGDTEFVVQNLAGVSPRRCVDKSTEGGMDDAASCGTGGGAAERVGRETLNGPRARSGSGAGAGCALAMASASSTPPTSAHDSEPETAQVDDPHNPFVMLPACALMASSGDDDSSCAPPVVLEADEYKSQGSGSPTATAGRADAPASPASCDSGESAGSWVMLDSDFADCL